MIIRKAEHKDAQSIIDSHIRSIREICAKDYNPEQIEAWAGRNFKTSLWCQTMDRDHVWVVEINSQVHGFGHLAIMDENTAEVMGLYLSPVVKGSGNGKKLFNIILEEARKNGVKEIQLFSTITAKSFYEHYGFRQFEGDCSVEMRGVAIPCYPMKLIL